MSDEKNWVEQEAAKNGVAIGRIVHYAIAGFLCAPAMITAIKGDTLYLHVFAEETDDDFTATCLVGSDLYHFHDSSLEG